MSDRPWARNAITATFAPSSPTRAGLLASLGRPYRYRGIPGWNPAAIAPGTADPLALRCETCGAPAGQQCQRPRDGVATPPRTTDTHKYRLDLARTP
jgi:hypothetical protein